jgi:long-chain acyl-CoA synthetase
MMQYFQFAHPPGLSRNCIPFIAVGVSTHCYWYIGVGVSQYDKIGIISNNRYEWAMIAFAAYSLNASLVPMYEAQLSSDWSYIVNDSGASVLFCSTESIFHRVNNDVLPMTPHVHSVLCLDKGTTSSGEDYVYQTALDRIRQYNTSNNGEDTPIITTIPPTPDDLADII